MYINATTPLDLLTTSFAAVGTRTDFYNDFEEAVESVDILLDTLFGSGGEEDEIHTAFTALRDIYQRAIGATGALVQTNTNRQLVWDLQDGVTCNGVNEYRQMYELLERAYNALTTMQIQRDAALQRIADLEGEIFTLQDEVNDLEEAIEPEEQIETGFGFLSEADAEAAANSASNTATATATFHLTPAGRAEVVKGTDIGKMLMKAIHEATGR